MRLTLQLLFIALFVLVAAGHAQSPPGINYQGVARNLDGKPLVLKEITIKINIVKGSDNGDVEYAEVHSMKTNSFGLFTLVIGTGSAVTGDFRFISWAMGDKWLRVEMDPDGGNSFQLMGSQQFMSVPYAFYAKYSGNSLTPGQGISITNNVITNTGDSDSNSSNELNTGFVLGSDRKLRITDAGGTKEADLTPLLVNQALNGVLSLGNQAGGQVIRDIGEPIAATDAATKGYVDSKIIPAVPEVDGSVTNEIQDLSFSANKLKITNNPSATEVDLSGFALKTYVDSKIATVDGSDSNEIQDLTFSSNKLRITNNSSATEVDLSSLAIDTDKQNLLFDGSKNLSIDRGNMVDISGVNTDSQVLSLAGTTLSISGDTGGNSVNLASINAPQSLNFDGTNLSISGGNSVNLGNLADDKQTLTLGGPTGDDLQISGGNSVSLLAFKDNTDHQDLTLVGNELRLSNDGTPVDLSNYQQNVSISGTAGTNTRTISVTGGTGGTFDVSDADSNSSNELQTLAYNSGTKRLTISSGNFVDMPETQNLNQVLTQGSDAGGQKITNLGAPTVNTDAVTKQYVDNADNAINTRISANYAFKTSFAYSNLLALGNDIPMPLSGEAFDDFSVVNTANFTAAVAGTYVFMVDGSISSIGGSVSVLYNGTKYPLAIGSNNRYNSSFMFRLTAGQTVSLVADGLGIGTNISGTFFGYKLL